MESPSAILAWYTGRLYRPVALRAHLSGRDSLRPVPASLRLLLPFALFLFTFALSKGCGLDWTLPQAHFEGVDEQGHVAYWEKIGQADLGDGLVIPVHIGFNSSRESSSPTIGKGWILPLLESHVEPVDENTMHVIMPDGWTFLFLRNGNTDTWRGNAGWVGQTDGARFTITAPCGWQVKFAAGKIQEIDTPKNRTITIKYNGPVPLEADLDNQPFVQVQQNTATGVAESITIAGQKIAITQAPRPRITTVLGKTLLTGFDPALSQLQWPDGNKESFNFSAPQSLMPTLVITKLARAERTFIWDAGTGDIVNEDSWHYLEVAVDLKEESLKIWRSNASGLVEGFESYPRQGITLTSHDGFSMTTFRFTNTGPLSSKTRKVVESEAGKPLKITSYSYSEAGRLLRVATNDIVVHFSYTEAGIINSIRENHVEIWKARVMAIKFQGHTRPQWLIVLVSLVILVMVETAISFALEGGSQDGHATSKDLVWKSAYERVKVSTANVPQSVVFMAHNVSGRSVHIVSVTPSCGCIQCDYSSRSLNANQWLRICATIVAPPESGSTKIIMVQTEDNQYSLVLDVQPGSAFKIQSRVFLWHVGEKEGKKMSEVILTLPQEKLRVICTDPRVSVNVASAAKGPDGFTIEVVPRKTTSAFISKFAIEIIGPDATKTTIPLYAIVTS